ncbi:single-stranded DNA-binding protein [Planobispora longispora]|uniref:Single-stranded DNA-binding protein n=1 Tax=Planobispora longispora TaxID=28887 RepID=A0A8J3W647_9ACTN|nr:hypothetical protein Plo01_35920 [Planobispora longispora]
MDRNEVVLAGRLPDLVQIKTLQSGTRFGSWRLIVRRQQRGRGARVDTIPCVSFEPGVVQSVAEWLPDDVVEVVGSLRRRWWGSQGSKASGYEVEVRSVKRLERRVTTVLTGDGEPSTDSAAPAVPAPASPRPLRSLLSTFPAQRPSEADAGSEPATGSEDPAAAGAVPDPPPGDIPLVSSTDPVSSTGPGSRTDPVSSTRPAPDADPASGTDLAFFGDPDLRAGCGRPLLPEERAFPGEEAGDSPVPSIGGVTRG